MLRGDRDDSASGCDVYDIFTREPRFVVKRDRNCQIRFYCRSEDRSFAKVNFPPGGPFVNERGMGWYFKDWYDPIFTSESP
jgi:hypothetical protein